MKLKAFSKDIRREFSKSFSRFLSITLIVCLGVGFFVGMKSTAPTMIHTAQNYFNSYNIMDFKLLSMTGFSQDDLEAVTELDDVDDAYLAYSVDAMITDTKSASALAFKFLSIPEEGRINQFNLIDGRMPQASGECVMGSDSLKGTEYEVGDVITVCDRTGDTEMSTVLVSKEYTVVGIVNTPLYFSYSYGTTSIGDGNLSGYIYLSADEFLYEKYTEMYVSVDIDYSKVTLFDDEYTQIMDDAEKKLQSIGRERQAITLKEISQQLEEQYSEAEQEASEQLDEAEKQLDDAKAELDDAKTGLVDARAELDDAKEQIEDGQKELDAGWAEYNAERGSYEQQVAEAQQKIAAGEAQLAEGKAQLETAKAELASAQQQITQGQQLLSAAQNMYTQAENTLNDSTMTSEEKAAAASTAVSSARTAISVVRSSGAASAYEESIAQAESMLNDFESGLATTDDVDGYLSSQLGTLSAQISDYSAQIEAAQAEADAAQLQIDEAEAQVAAGEAELAAGKAEYNAAVAEAERQFAEARDQLKAAEGELTAAKKEYESGEEQYEDGVKQYNDGMQEYKDGLTKYRESEADAKDELGKAAAQIQNAQASFVELSYDKWYVFDRSDVVPSYSGLQEDASRIDALAVLFPVFFLIVAALVCVTTMTRMVDEQRGQMGTYKALGYSKKQIMRKYLTYALVASIFGGVIGELIFYNVFPKIIINAYSILYYFPHVELQFPVVMGIIALCVGILCTAFVTYICCRKEISSVTASLMRPRAPKAGRQIRLERTKLWNKFGFSTKITIRNLVRYKVRVLMTVLGISGCTALILAGFGLKNALDPIVPLQYGTLCKYDYSIAVYDAYTDETAARCEQDMLENDELQLDTTTFTQYSEISVTDEDSKKAVEKYCYLCVPNKKECFDKQWVLRDKAGNPVELTADGVVLTDKLAKILNASAGDTVNVVMNEKEYAVKVTGVIENYVQHCVYMLPELYTAVTGEEPGYNMIYCTMDEGCTPDPELVLASDNNLLAVTVMEEIVDYMEDSFQSMNMVILVLILSASALAVVVLYNLTNINISERIREIATVKVLGFTQKESNLYIFRENVIMTFISLCLGCGAGYLLDQVIIDMVETDMVAFARKIYPMSYVYAVGITIAVTLGVMLLMHFKIKKIDMVEALKSIE